jgi:hypothetical protein
MNLVDSCGWLEYFADGPHADFYSGSHAALGSRKKGVVPAGNLVRQF